MDIVERLRMKVPMSFQMDWTDRAKAADEIERLREDKAELLKALTDLWAVSHWADNPYEMDAAKLAIAKVAGGE